MGNLPYSSSCGVILMELAHLRFCQSRGSYLFIYEIVVIINLCNVSDQLRRCIAVIEQLS
jgi:hypothetical protein